MDDHPRLGADGRVDDRSSLLFRHPTTADGRRPIGGDVEYHRERTPTAVRPWRRRRRGRQSGSCLADGRRRLSDEHGGVEVDRRRRCADQLGCGRRREIHQREGDRLAALDDDTPRRRLLSTGGRYGQTPGAGNVTGGDGVRGGGGSGGSETAGLPDVLVPVGRAEVARRIVPRHTGCRRDDRQISLAIISLV